MIQVLTNWPAGWLVVWSVCWLIDWFTLFIRPFHLSSLHSPIYRCINTFIHYHSSCRTTCSACSNHTIHIKNGIQNSVTSDTEDAINHTWILGRNYTNSAFHIHALIRLWMNPFTHSFVRSFVRSILVYFTPAQLHTVSYSRTRTLLPTRTYDTIRARTYNLCALIWLVFSMRVRIHIQLFMRDFSRTMWSKYHTKLADMIFKDIFDTHLSCISIY